MTMAAPGMGATSTTPSASRVAVMWALRLMNRCCGKKATGRSPDLKLVVFVRMGTACDASRWISLLCSIALIVACSPPDVVGTLVVQTEQATPEEIAHTAQ